MSCLEIVPRREIRLCHGCKAWYCRECYEDHNPCNRVFDLKNDENGDDNTTEETTTEEAVDDSKPGVWIIREPESEREQFDFWRYIA